MTAFKISNEQPPKLLWISWSLMRKAENLLQTIYFQSCHLKFFVYSEWRGRYKKTLQHSPSGRLQEFKITGKP